LGWISCSKKEAISVGDHLIIIGLVNDFEIFDNNKKPLIFWSGNYQI
jgi:flavin reductase (DIM6/NTAB) family NADH-FMN oxidoreductase RutF